MNSLSKPHHKHKWETGTMSMILMTICIPSHRRIAKTLLHRSILPLRVAGRMLLLLVY